MPHDILEYFYHQNHLSMQTFEKAYSSQAFKESGSKRISACENGKGKKKGEILMYKKHLNFVQK